MLGTIRLGPISRVVRTVRQAPGPPDRMHARNYPVSGPSALGRTP
jgi:hypothetical protein